ncbi:MAG: Uma2 family endonuclease [Leptolyngbyaceae bacterium]|nr:Uma2 family endonuclease [Leptolyngbyaceae bacterium]
MVQELTISDSILYPDSDGKPMADNTLQYDWIVRLVGNLRQLFKGQTVFVAGDLLWYPVKVNQPPAPCQAPDAMVVFGRPPGYRGSYKQWQEDNIAPQVVFEILSPSNTSIRMLEKQSFYEKYGVLEMFFYDPESSEFLGQVRSAVDQPFETITPLNFPWHSPLLGIRFEMFEDGLAVFYPNGEEFKLMGDYMDERDQLAQERDLAQQERDRAFAKLRELGIDPEELG